MMTQKEKFRAQLSEMRNRMPASEVMLKSRAITSALNESIDWRKVNSVHIYKSVPRWKEVDTTRIFTELGATEPNILVVSPALRKDASLPKQKFDLIIVPVLGFDKDRNRLGLGGGWYDKFLATQPQALKVGLAYELSFAASGLPVEPHDIPLDIIITEKRIIRAISEDYMMSPRDADPL